jgi:hypothetical protein
MRRQMISYTSTEAAGTSLYLGRALPQDGGASKAKSTCQRKSSCRGTLLQYLNKITCDINKSQIFGDTCLVGEQASMPGCCDESQSWLCPDLTSLRAAQAPGTSCRHDPGRLPGVRDPKGLAEPLWGLAIDIRSWSPQTRRGIELFPSGRSKWPLTIPWKYGENGEVGKWKGRRRQYKTELLNLKPSKRHQIFIVTAVRTSSLMPFISVKEYKFHRKYKQQNFIHSFINGSTSLCWVLASSSGSLSFFAQTVGLLGRGISLSQGRYLHTEQHKFRINAHADNHALSGIRTHDPSVRASEDSSCFRERGRCDRHKLHHH